MPDSRFSDKEFERRIIGVLNDPRAVNATTKVVFGVLRDRILFARLRWDRLERNRKALLQEDTFQRVEGLLQKLVKEGKVIELDGRFILTPAWRKQGSRIKRESTIIERTLSLLKEKGIVPIVADDVLRALREKRKQMILKEQLETPPTIEHRRDIQTFEQLREFFFKDC